jgi:hypothetical protein
MSNLSDNSRRGRTDSRKSAVQTSLLRAVTDFTAYAHFRRLKKTQPKKLPLIFFIPGDPIGCCHPRKIEQ